MSFLFNRPKVPLSQQPQILHGIPVTESGFGGVIPIQYGQGRLGVKLIGYWDFTAIAITDKSVSGGKGLGSSAAQQKSYIYRAAVQMALCEGDGKIQLVNVWNSKGALTLVKVSENFTVPGGGGSYQVANHANYYLHYGVSRADAYSVGANDFGSDGPVTLAGTQATPMAKVASGPAAGQYTENPATGTFAFAAGDVGKTVTITYVYSVPDTNTNGQPLQDLSLTLFPGSRPQTPWAYLTSAHPGQDLAYPGLAYLANEQMDLGSSGSLPSYTYEVLGLKPFGGGIVDAEPSAIVIDLLENQFYGCGWDPALIGDVAGFKNYCIANGLFFSPTIDSQQPAAQIIDELVDLANGAAIWSEGVVKLKSYGDTTAVANGATFFPDTAPKYDLNDQDFLRSGSDDPVKLMRKSRADCYNSVKVEFRNRANSYNVDIAQDKDDASIALFGLREDSPRQGHAICDANVAKKVANNIRLRSVYIDGGGSYQFSLGWQYVLLEPMDIVTLTDANLGLNKRPVRITSIKENEDGKLDFEAEDFPWGTATPTLYPHSAGAGFAPDQLADPGSVNAPVLFVPTNRMTGGAQDGYQVWIGVSGAGPDWGGCHVWVSADGTTYQRLDGTIHGSARTGVLSAALASSTDPDTTHTLQVDLTESLGVLSSGSLADADNFRTAAVIVDGSGAYEVISYETLTLTAPNKYTSNAYLRRGGLGTAPGAHSIGARFLRIDEAIFQYIYDPLLLGTTLHFKFTSFNKSELMEQNVANVTAYSLSLAAPSAPAGVTAVGDALGVRLSWSDAAGVIPIETYNVYRNTTNNPAAATKITSVSSNASAIQTYYDKSASVNTLYYYWITAASAGGAVESAKSSVVSSAGIGPGTHSSYRPTSNPLTATDAGASVTVSVAAFNMQIGGLLLAYGSGSIASLSYNTIYYIYVLDPGFAGTASYHATSSKDGIISSYDQLYVGSIRTPAAGGTDTVGNNDGGSGAQNGNTFVMSPQQATIIPAPGTTTPWQPIGPDASGVGINLSNAADGDTSTFITLPSHGGTTGSIFFEFGGFPAFSANWTSLKLKIKTAATGTTLADLEYSLDAGGTWTTIYSTTSRAVTVDVVSLSVTQAIPLIQVRCRTRTSSTIDLYEIWLEGQF